jgi:hypothetical protein
MDVLESTAFAVATSSKDVTTEVTLSITYNIKMNKKNVIQFQKERERSRMRIHALE